MLLPQALGNRAFGLVSVLSNWRSKQRCHRELSQALLLRSFVSFHRRNNVCVKIYFLPNCANFHQLRLKPCQRSSSSAGSLAKWFGTMGCRWKRWRKWRRKRRGSLRANGTSRWEDAALADPPWSSEGHRRSAPLRSSRRMPRNLIVARTRIHAAAIVTCKNLFYFIDACTKPRDLSLFNSTCRMKMCMLMRVQLRFRQDTNRLVGHT